MEWNASLHTMKRKWKISEAEIEDEWMKRRKVEGVDMTGMFSAIAAAAVLEEKGRKERGKKYRKRQVLVDQWDGKLV